MARPNDPPPPPESIENLKRRFTRQNRDIVRNNSAQAIRIRNLETEVARLLDENLSLRHNLITETEEVARLRNKDVLNDELLAVKFELEKKLADANALVGQIGRLPGQSQRNKRAERRESTTNSKASTPTRESWQRRQMLMPSLQDQEGRLPAITEGKSFPRLTLDPADLQTYIEADSGAQTDSPDIGPPPVTQFYETATEPQEGLTEGEIQETQDVNTSVTLERRRKRRTSSLISDMEVVDIAAEPARSGETHSAQEPRRPSTKRKLDVSQLEEESQKAAIGSMPDQEKFVYHRRPALKPASAARKSNRFTRPAERPAQEPPAVEAKSPQKDSRNALGPKSTNSPIKKTLDSKPADQDKGVSNGAVRRLDSGLETRRRQEDGAGSAIGRPPTRGKTAAKQGSGNDNDKAFNPRFAIPSDKELDSQSDPDNPPKTPFLPDDILSPPSSQPSGPSNARATQEAVIMNSVEDVLNGSIGRGSRRAKATVSYAEPNLRDKMRRPGKELVGAVEGYARSKREGSLGLEPCLNRPASDEPTSSAQPPRWSASEGGQEEPGSPLREKQLLDDRRKRGSLDLQAWARGESQAPSHGQSKSQERDSVLAQIGKNVEGLSIFDPPVSSPSSHESPNNSSAIQVHVAPVSNTSRRKTGGRTPVSKSTEDPATLSSPSNRRHSLQHTSSAGGTSRAIANRVSRSGSNGRPTSATGVSRPSSAASNRSEVSRAREAPKAPAGAERRSSASLLGNHSTCSEVSRAHARIAGNDSSISNSDVEDESDYEPTHLSMSRGAIDNSNLRATRRRSMVV